MMKLKHHHLIGYVEHFYDDCAFYLVMDRRGTRWGADDSNMAFLNQWLQEHLLAISGSSDSQSSVSLNGSSSLFDFLRHHRQVPSHLVSDLFLQAASGLAYLHRQSVFHGDVKIENMIVEESGTGEHRLYLCDFGHSQKCNSGETLMCNYGTFPLFAPELIPNVVCLQRFGDVDKMEWFDGFAQDVWALGLVLYTLAFGAPPSNLDDLCDGKLDLSQATHLPAIYSTEKVGHDCVELVQSMLAIDPNSRPTMEQVLAHPFCRQTLRC